MVAFVIETSREVLNDSRAIDTSWDLGSSLFESYSDVNEIEKACNDLEAVESGKIIEPDWAEKIRI